MSHSNNTYSVSLSGLVQGVGFRPFVWRIANEMRLNGCVYNDSAGVNIQLNADEKSLKEFTERLKSELPPLARIDHIECEQTDFYPYLCFEIIESQQGKVSTGCAADASTCEHCREELFDPENWRYRYPFINCTDCGPRLSIIRQIPYDRASTTMADFKQCPSCLAEYQDPANRRYHAQPNACAECGPLVWVEDADGNRVEAEDPFRLLQETISAGGIIAVKGLGGFHLVCDATNDSAIAELRRRKHRPDKAFALMVKNAEVLSDYAECNASSLALLKSNQAPVVLLDPLRKNDSNYSISDHIAPGQYQLGFMLPYTPVHHLLMENIVVPVVMTSGNRSGSPQAISNEGAREQLHDIADLFLMHNRPIQNRVDDSVVRKVSDELHILRRARGYAPGSIQLPVGFENTPDLVALGGELKNTLCLLQAGQAIVTQHLGDLEDVRTYEQYQSTLNLYRNLYQFETNHYICDLHPEYLSSKFGEQLAEQGKHLVKVQHHHAHLASCLGDNGYPLSGKPVLGICLDGTGYGLDETLWGGEFLLGNYQQIERLAHIKPFPLIGGVKAIIEPWRCLYAILKQSMSAEEITEFSLQVPALSSPLCKTFDKMMEQGLNCHMTSSAGRLFDAVAAALGCHGEKISYEGQAAIELETLARQGARDTMPYKFNISDNQIDPSRCFRDILTDLQNQRPKADIALAFHLGFANAVVAMSHKLRTTHQFDAVALSGGVMQNEILYRAITDKLASDDLTVLTHNELPANDGGLSFGQALIGAAQLLG